MNRNQKETRFKIVVYFDKKSNGEIYTDSEIRDKKHLKRMGSFDYIRTRYKKSLLDEKNAFRLMVHHLESSIYGRYKTAIIVINNYRGYNIVLRKYVCSNIKMGMQIQFMKNTDNSKRVYNIPDANDLIKAFESGTINAYQEKLIKKYDPNIPIANAYLTKFKKTS